MAEGNLNHSIRQPKRPLIIALGVSVLAHLLLVVLVHYVPRWEWLQKSRVLSSLIREAKSLDNPLIQPRKQSEKDREPEAQYPTVFVEIPKEQEVSEPPKETQYYSDKSSVAANPNPEPLKLKDAPKIEGTQDKVIRLADNQAPKPPPPPPDADQPPPKPKQEPKPELKKPEPVPPKPESEPSPGDLALSKPSPSPIPLVTAAKPPPQTLTPTPAPPPKPAKRPRTLAQVFDQSPQLRGEKFKQAGGVKKRGITAALDVRASTFGAYDQALIHAIEERWFQLLDENDYSGERVGKVVLEFKLKYDGSVMDMKVVETSVGEVLGLLCLRAVKDPERYETWPSDMRLLYSSGFREVRFTFYYN